MLSDSHIKRSRFSVRQLILESEAFLSPLCKQIYVRCSTYLLYVTQFIAWVVCSIIFHLQYKLDIQEKEKLAKLQAPLIIISNHITFYDGFIIRVALGAFPERIMPLRFMAVIKFNKLFLNILTWTGIVPLVYFILGVFVIQQGQGLEKNLEKAKDRLALKQTVVMFPEGKMITDQDIGPFKKGAAALASMTGAPIFPISLRKIPRKGKRTVMRINFGDIHHVSTQHSHEQNTETLHMVVKTLYERT